jgi:flagellar biosynthesis protein FlhA
MRRTALLLPALVIGLVMVLFVPLPTQLLDLLLAMNIIISVVTLAAVVGVGDPVEFSAFPTMILIATAARLALTVSTSRLILLHGYAGEVIQTFGRFVVGQNVVVGLVIFLVLTIINLLVITKGSERASEVAARFSLDAMPGKQMAVDADLAAGLLDETGARAARRRIALESDFYGAMDGAVKFVKGDATAGLIIVMVNLFGGFGIGLVSRHLPLGEAANTYSLLTVGDGLVAQIPALLMSLATGLLVNRVKSDQADLGRELGAQLFRGPTAARIGAGASVFIGLLPGMPKLPFLAAAIGLWTIATRRKNRVVVETPVEEHLVRIGPDDPEALIAQMRIEPLELRLAFDCVDVATDGDLLARVRELRRQLALELGFVLPQVSTADDATLAPGEYRIAVAGVEVGGGRVSSGCVLALPDPSFGSDDHTLAALGERVVEPVFGLVGYWVPEAERQTAAAVGATLVSRSAAIVTHLAELSRRHSPDLLTRQQVAELVEGLRTEQPLLANEVGNDRVPVATLHQVLRALLSDRIGIRDLGRIVETLSSTVGTIRAPEQLADECRAALGAQIASRLAPNNRVAALLMVPAMEGQLMSQVREIDGSAHLALEPDAVERLRNAVAEAWERVTGADPVVLVCAPGLRRPLSRLLAAGGLDLPTLAYRELPTHLAISTTEVIGSVL